MTTTKTHTAAGVRSQEMEAKECFTRSQEGSTINECLAMSQESDHHQDSYSCRRQETGGGQEKVTSKEDKTHTVSRGTKRPMEQADKDEPRARVQMTAEKGASKIVKTVKTKLLIV